MFIRLVISIYLVGVAFAVELVLQTELRQHVLIKRIVLVLEFFIVIEVNNSTFFNEHVDQALRTNFYRKP